VANSIVSGGCVISGASVTSSVLSPNVHIESDACVEESVLLDHVHIGAGARIRKAIIDRDVVVPAGFTLGYDFEQDKSRFDMSEGGVVILPRGTSLQ
jgi:glucose-1-phosphate adenylyltransferase